ncbi:MAG TPA: hypothetical protein VGF84_00320 [Micromonosporaceae bacterium]|jgi:hypothetical protein
MTTPDQPQYAPPPAPKAASKYYIRIADALIAVGALIMFLFSFAPFISVDAGFGVTGHQNAWNFETPVVLFVVFAAILLLASAFLDTFWHRDKQIVGLNRHHVQVGLALYAFVTLIAFALADKGPGVGFGWGGIFMLLGVIVATAGAVLNHFNLVQGPLSLPASSPKPVGPAAYPPAQGGYAPPQPQGYAPPQQQGYAPTQVDPGYAQPAQPGYTPPPAPVDPQGPPTA